MKKIYSTFFAALCALGAVAANFNVYPQDEFTLPEPAETLELASTTAGVMSAGDVLSPMAVTHDSYIGEYEWHYRSTATGEMEVGEAIITEGNLTSEVKIMMTLKGGAAFTVKAGFNPLDNSIFIVKQYVGKAGKDTPPGEGTPLYIMNVVRDATNAIVEGPMLTGKLNESTRTITIDGNIAVATTDVSWISLIVTNNSFVRVDEGIYAGYRLLGTGTFKDGIFGPMISQAESNNPPYDVDVYESISTPGNYRIDNPWSGPGLTSLGELGGHLDIDATDPEYVRVPLTKTYHINGEDGMTCIISQAAMYVKYMRPALEKADFLAKFPQYNITFDKETNTVNFPPNCIFFVWPEGSDPSAFHSANFPYSGYLKLPAAASIGNITDDGANSDAPVEYFNLQGMKVDNPEPGQIVIRRQGSDVKKIRVN